MTFILWIMIKAMNPDNANTKDCKKAAMITSSLDFTNMNINGKDKSLAITEITAKFLMISIPWKNQFGVNIAPQI